eukprot:gene255-274_t
MIVAMNCIGFFLISWLFVAHGNPLLKAWKQAIRQSLYEQEVEDVNSVHRFDNHLVRRLIVMPLTDAFKTNQVDAMYGKIQYGDKCSLPSSIGKLIFEKRYEVPWLFEIKPVARGGHHSGGHEAVSEYAPPTPTSSTTQETKVEDGEVKVDHEVVAPYFRQGRLDKAYVSPLDFRAPENYIFLPRWLMNDLGLKPSDLVDISFVRIKLADLVVFQPLSLSWDDLIKEHPDPKSLLEHEINKYSSLTAGSTIYIEIKGKEYPLHIKTTKAEGGVAVKAVRVQDSDVRTDIDRSLLGTIIDEKKKDKRRAK